MSKLSDKYIAGFLDADGSIQIMWRPVDRADSNPSLKRAYVSLEFSQKADRDGILYRIKDAIGGEVYHSDNRSAQLKVSGAKAEMALRRIRKHLVLKRHYADFILDIAGKVVNREEMSESLKHHRRIRSLPLPNYPPRQWLAGYFDGDGCLQARLPKGRTAVQPSFEITSSEYDAEGIDIICKNFGGTILVTGHEGQLRKLIITLPPSKAKQLLGYFSKHLVLKREQAQFILGCAEMGHYRDGKSIKAVMKQLKAHPHRLNEPRPNVAALLASVRDIKSDRIVGREKWNELGGRCRCGSTEYYCDGLCRKCYDKKRWAKR